MMTIFTRDLIHRIIARVLLPLCLPCVTSQQDWEPLDDERKPMSPGATVGIVLFSLSLFCIIFSCAMYTVCSFSSSSIEAEGHEVLRSTGATSGVDKDILESFPFFLYSEVKELKIGKGGVECAICLKEFEVEDLLRWMPPCSHTFHVNCIDEWLSSRSTCPVCRANLSLKPGDESFLYPSLDLEMGNVRRGGVQESPDDISLIGNNANNRITRSRSTGSLSSWRMAKIFYTRSHSTGHSLVQQGKTLDRFTLQLPEEVQRELVSLNLIRRSHMALPRAMSSRQGYISGFSQGRKTLRRAISMFG